ncbi:MAG: peptidoglycan-binding protein [Gammaproteobacteria bacterium]
MQHLAAAFEVDAQLSDALLHRHVERAQRRYRLEPDGVLGPTTLRVLERGLERRIVYVVGGAGRGF